LHRVNSASLHFGAVNSHQDVAKPDRSGIRGGASHHELLDEKVFAVQVARRETARRAIAYGAHDHAHPLALRHVPLAAGRSLPDVALSEASFDIISCFACN